MTNNKPPIIKVNESLIKLSISIGELNRQLKNLRDDVECIKSYISKEEERKRVELKKKEEELSKGWFFS